MERRAKPGAEQQRGRQDVYEQDELVEPVAVVVADTAQGPAGARGARLDASTATFFSSGPSGSFQSDGIAQVARAV